MNLIKLESVGSFLDMDSGMVYPMLLDGTIDLMKGSAYHILYDTGGFDEDGFELYALADTADRTVIEEYLETTK
tara:strand:- start:263 stop:484 length:222 start_codon:yes stop_codon:yes gene_type:complete